MQERLGPRFAGTLSPDIDEKAIGDRSTWRAEDLVLTIARAKCDALAGLSSEALGAAGFKGNELLLCCDQVVRCEGAIREKPIDAAEALRFARSYSAGAAAECVNGLVCLDLASGKRAERCMVVKVHMGPMSETQLQEFVAEPALYSCAGGLRIEDPRMTVLRLEPEGCEDGVMGLPIAVVLELAQELSQ